MIKEVQPGWNSPKKKKLWAMREECKGVLLREDAEKRGGTGCQSGKSTTATETGKRNKKKKKRYTGREGRTWA